MKRINFIFTLVFAAFLSACSYAPANVQTMFTKDCGMTWEVIKTGQAIPKAIGPCEYKTTVPDYPMQGDADFKASFQKGVLVSIKTSYDYQIVDPVLFIGEAKFLGKVSDSSEISGKVGTAYETAENQVIDKRIREATTSMLVDQDIVNFQAAEFEDKLLDKINEELKKRGVKLNTMTFIVVPEEQTRMAIDAAVAMKVYENAGLGELGQKALVARAGATKVIVESSLTPTKKDD